MSSVEVRYGSARVELDGREASSIARTHVVYQPRDLLEATASALMAVNTTEAAAYARGILELLASRPD